MVIVVALHCNVLFCTILYYSVLCCRMAMVVALSTVEGKLSNTLLRFEGLIVSMTASALTLTAILILNFLYTRVAVWLTDKELHRWQCQQAFICSGAKTHFCSHGDLCDPFLPPLL